MNTVNLKFWTPGTFLLILLLWAINPGTSRAEAVNSGRLLRQAYLSLLLADHDYNGHRIEAMKEIETAAKLLKIEIKENGQRDEQQGVSDEQLRAARSLLDQAREGLETRPRKHVEKAIKQIDVALKIR
jgi:hypothetical protein